VGATSMPLVRKESSRICNFFSRHLGEFVKLPKTTITFVTPVHMLDRPFAKNCSVLAKWIFVKFYIGRRYTEINLSDSGSGKIILDMKI
jgi:hypothetical protein